MAIESACEIYSLACPGWGDVLVAVSLLCAACAWLYDRYKERMLREEELKWKRTEFIFDQAGLFDGENEISEAVKIITDNNASVSVEKLLDLKSDMNPFHRGDGRHKLDKLLNLMERIAYAFSRGILTIDELSHFEWYFIRVTEIEVLNDYCAECYPTIIKSATSLKENGS